MRTSLPTKQLWCDAHRTGVICYSPMQSGIRTDTFSAARVARMADDDWRLRSADILSPNLERNIALRPALGVGGGGRVVDRLFPRTAARRMFAER